MITLARGRQIANLFTGNFVPTVIDLILVQDFVRTPKLVNSTRRLR